MENLKLCVAELQDIFHAILEEVQEEHYDWGFEALMDEANRLFMERGFGDFNELE